MRVSPNLLDLSRVNCTFPSRKYNFKSSKSCSVLVIQRILHKERRRTESANTANAKLLHECEILLNRLQECSVNFLVEEEDNLIMDTSSPSDAIDLLTTSDNRIGLLLAEVCYAPLVLVLFIHLVSYIRNLYSSTIACWSMTAFIYMTKLHVHFFIYESYLHIVLVPPVQIIMVYETGTGTAPRPGRGKHCYGGR